MAQQSMRRGRKNQSKSTCSQHASLIWIRSSNSHTGPRLLYGRTEAGQMTGLDLRVQNFLKNLLAFWGASTDDLGLWWSV